MSENTEYPLSASQIAEILARAEAATKGPWRMIEYEGAPYVASVGDCTVMPCGETGDEAADADFIASARTDVPALCRTIEALRPYAEACVAAQEQAKRVLDASEQRIADMEALTARLIAERDAALRRVDQVEGLFLELEGITANGELLPTREKALEYIAALIADRDAAREEAQRYREIVGALVERQIRDALNVYVDLRDKYGADHPDLVPLKEVLKRLNAALAATPEQEAKP